MTYRYRARIVNTLIQHTFHHVVRRLSCQCLPVGLDLSYNACRNFFLVSRPPQLVTSTCVFTCHLVFFFINTLHHLYAVSRIPSYILIRIRACVMLLLNGLLFKHFANIIVLSSNDCYPFLLYNISSLFACIFSISLLAYTPGVILKSSNSNSWCIFLPML